MIGVKALRMADGHIKKLESEAEIADILNRMALWYRMYMDQMDGRHDEQEISALDEELMNSLVAEMDAAAVAGREQATGSEEAAGAAESGIPAAGAEAASSEDSDECWGPWGPEE